MNWKEHYNFLEQLYQKANVNENVFTHSKLIIDHKQAIINWPVDEKLFHAGNGLHGSIIFKLLDDAAYFAAASVEKDYFLLTSGFHIHFYRPVDKGELTAKGTLIQLGKNHFEAKAELRNEKQKLIAEGQGTFLRSQKKWLDHA